MSGRVRTAVAAAAVASLVAFAACGGGEGGEGGGIERGPDPAAAPESADDEPSADPDEEEIDGEDGDGDDDGGGDGQPAATTEVTVGPIFSGRGAIEFGEHDVGAASDPVSVLIRNAQLDPVVMTSVEVGGDNPAEFVIEATTCEPGLELESQETCETVLVFRPVEAGERSALLLVTITGGAGAQVPLLGQASG